MMHVVQASTEIASNVQSCLAMLKCGQLLKKLTVPFDVTGVFLLLQIPTEF